MSTKIEYCDETWSPITGCTPVSEGCANCWAKRMANRLRGRYGYPADEPFRVTFHPDKLDKPSHWKKPRRIFVCSMGDLFHEAVDIRNHADVLAAMCKAPQHTYILLTKRPGYVGWESSAPTNWWLGVTAETQNCANRRLPILESIPCQIKWVSLEPLLGPVDLTPWLESLDWVIVGAETGPGKRPMDIQWARDIRDQCVSAGTPFFFKKTSDGNHTLDGKTWEQWPND